MIIYLTAAALMISLLFSSCAGESAGGTYLVYYTNNMADDILYRQYKMNNEATKDCYAKVSELLDQMFNADLEDESLYSVKPDTLNYEFNFNNESKVLTINFSPEYKELTNVEEIILRSSVVLTLIQVEEIRVIEFLVDKEPLTDSNGRVIGKMTADDFVNILLNEEGMLRKEARVKLMFANEDGSALIAVPSVFEISSNNTSQEQYVIQMLIAGPPEGSGAYRTLSSDVQLLGTVTADRICYLNFSSSFANQDQPVSDEIMIYSIVNSLCRLNGVDAVQFQIDGESNVTLHYNTDLSAPFYPNYSLEAE